jgi:autotransporter-associated beta strand protein
VSGGVNLTSRSLVVSSAGTMNVTGAIRGRGRDGIIKEDRGTLVLSGSNSYTGTTSVLDGTLLVNGSIASTRGVNVGPSATLGGNGTIAGSMVIRGGTIEPGTSPSLLRVGSVTFTPGSAFEVELEGTNPGSGYDQLSVTGSVALGGCTLIVSRKFSSAQGRTCTIVSNDGSDPISGTFNGLAEGGTFNTGGVLFRITYTGGSGNDVVLTQLN